MANIAREYPSQHTRQRFVVLIIIIGTCFLVLGGRFFLVQVAQRDHYVKLSNKNRLKAIPLEASRGLILDRNGTVMVDNQASYSLSSIPLELAEADEKAIVTRTARLLDMDRDRILQKIHYRKTRSFEPIKLQRNVGFSQLSQLEENREKYPGIIIQVEPQRKYLYKKSAAHLLGYIGEMNEQEYQVLRKKGYLYGSLIGKDGIEKQYESYLRGTPGIKYVEVNASGRKVGELEEKYYAPEAGNNLVLTIDIGLQELAESCLPDSVKGALVVMDPRSGAILTMVSRPPFDPNVFSDVMTPDTWQQLNNSNTQPLLNRAIQGQYPPGSVLKLLTAITGLEKKAIDRHTLFRSCTGTYRFGKRHFRCWKERGHGRLDVHEALVQSCDIFFYQLIQSLELDDWAAYARLFGLGRATGIDLTGERKGLVPDKAFMDAKYGKQGWTEGHLLNLAIGQGDVLATPLQVALYTAVIANQGRMVIPHLVKRVVAPSGKILKEFTPPHQEVLDISQGTLDLIHQSMVDVVEHPQGTGRACRLPGIAVAGKTGSAENPHGQTHAWFTAFAPAGEPRYVVTVVVENAGHGGSVAAPIARQVLTWLFKQEAL